MKQIKVLNTLKIGNDTAIVIQDNGKQLRNNIVVLDDNKIKHKIISVGLSINLQNPEITNLLIEGNFQSNYIYIEDVYMKQLTQEQKEQAWKRMDTGIYDSHGNLIGDKCAKEDAYED